MKKNNITVVNKKLSLPSKSKTNKKRIPLFGETVKTTKVKLAAEVGEIRAGLVKIKDAKFGVSFDKMK